MSEDIVYEQYINDMKQYTMFFNRDVMNYTEKKDMEEKEQNNESVDDLNKLPFHMKVFQRRIEKFTSYRENQKYIRKQNKVIHTKIASIKDVNDNNEK